MRDDSGTLTWVVAMGAPNTLFYNCGLHSTMTGQINVVNPASVGDGPIVTSMQVVPNPARGRVSFVLSADLAGAEIEVLDLGGRRVARLPGSASTSWDGRGEGVELAPGVYVARASTADGAPGDSPTALARSLESRGTAPPFAQHEGGCDRSEARRQSVSGGRALAVIAVLAVLPIASLQARRAECSPEPAPVRALVDDGAWTQLPTPGRAGHTVVGDLDRDRLILFGGSDPVTRNDLWWMPLGGGGSVESAVRLRNPPVRPATSHRDS